MAQKSFVELLDADSLKLFKEVSQRKFSEQAMFVLNAFYDELKDQAEVIYNVSWEVIKGVDMRHRNIQYLHLYEEGNELGFDMALYLFESLWKFFQDPKNKKWAVPEYQRSIPQEMTAIVRKKEIRDKVDCDCDGSVSFMEYLLYQYDLSPKDLMERSKNTGEPEEVRKARLALEEVNKRIQAYEAEKARLEKDSELPGVRGLSAKNLLAQLHAGPLAEDLRRALITAEAALRIASRKYGSGSAAEGGSVRTDGTMWWLNRDLQAKKDKYGK